GRGGEGAEHETRNESLNVEHVFLQSVRQLTREPSSNSARQEAICGPVSARPANKFQAVDLSLVFSASGGPAAIGARGKGCFRQAFETVRVKHPLHVFGR
ncbi:MAG: hypothetical protein LPJ92_16385, partial [Rhodobacterales bacterium]|nr:hypothetical protein [Rhodobacterales bacterium]MDX5391912.1 hypothetical protein [Rhodobacterales bacterium]MDX5491612.1 hypothetical protein [Rhodobacterales bacterium]